MAKRIKDIIPAAHAQIRSNVVEKDSLSGLSMSKSEWAQSLDLPRFAEYTFFAGCGYQHMNALEGMMQALERSGQFGLSADKSVKINAALKKIGIDAADFIARASTGKKDNYLPTLYSAISVLRKLKVEVGYLHEEEPCCGSPMYYAGYEKDFADQARRNYDLFKSCRVNKLISIIPGCTSALKNGYRKYVEGYDLQVQHLLEIVAERLQSLAIKPEVKHKRVVTYHDPCQLSRYLKILDEPRIIINSIAGIEFVEPDVEQRGKWSSCCGGGGLEITHTDLFERIGQRRIEELLNTGADTILSNCPACEYQLTRSAKKMGADVEIMNLTKLLDEAL